MLDKFGVNSRLPGIMRLQMMPSRMIEWDPETHKPLTIRT